MLDTGQTTSTSGAGGVGEADPPGRTGPPSEGSRWPGAAIVGRLASRYSGLGVWVVFMVVFTFWAPHTFLNVATLTTSMSTQAITIVLAMAILPGLAVGEFDISFANNMAMGGILLIHLQLGGMSPFLASVIAVCVCTGAGVLNAFVVIRVGISSFIATLGTSSIFLAVGELISAGNEVGPMQAPGFQHIANNQIGPVPLVFVYAVVLAAIVWYVLGYTKLGRRLAATGANLEAARLVGVRTTRLRFSYFVYAGFVSGLAGVLLAAQFGSLGDTTGTAYLLPTYAACFLGSTQLRPGRFTVPGFGIAILLLSTGIAGFSLVGGQIWVPDMFNGVALVGAVGFAVMLQGKQGTSTMHLAPGFGKKK